MAFSPFSISLEGNCEAGLSKCSPLSFCLADSNPLIVLKSEEDDLFDLPIDQIKNKSEKKLKDESSESDDDRPPYNPMNLPIGWDGKPIPYWLYKLNGLNKEFKCEICGNYSYWGRRAFERHFQEWRHAYGMRCLRVPNTQHFRDITRIDEAIKCNLYCSA